MAIATRHWLAAGAAALALHGAIGLALIGSPSGGGERVGVGVAVTLRLGTMPAAHQAKASGPVRAAGTVRAAKGPGTTHPAVPTAAVARAETLPARRIHAPPVSLAERGARTASGADHAPRPPSAKTVAPSVRVASPAERPPQPRSHSPSEPQSQPAPRPPAEGAGPAVAVPAAKQAQGDDGPPGGPSGRVAGAPMAAGQGTAAAPQPGPSGPPGAVEEDARAGYVAALQAWLERHKQYPERAIARRQQGTATLYFVVDRTGRVLDYRLEQSSGHRLLDRETLALIERAAPLPQMPPGLQTANLAIILPIRFALR